MKKSLISILAFAISFCLAACSSTKITEQVYDETGTVLISEKTTETNESPIVVAFSNMKDKHIVAHMGGWYANIGVNPDSNSYGIGAGSIDNTYASLVATQDGKQTDAAAVAAYFPAIVDASKYSLSISTEGINSEGGTTSTTSTITNDDTQTESTSETETSTEAEAQ